MKYLIAILMLVTVTGITSAKEPKFVATWEGPYATPIYTKIVFHKDKSLTYCEVSSCRDVNCGKMSYAGSLQSKFTYEDNLGRYEFEWTGDEEITAKYINPLGDISSAVYEPE